MRSGFLLPQALSKLALSPSSCAEGEKREASLATMPPLVLRKVAESIKENDRFAFSLTCKAFRQAIQEVVNPVSAEIAVAACFQSKHFQEFRQDVERATKTNLSATWASLQRAVNKDVKAVNKKKLVTDLTRSSHFLPKTMAPPSFTLGW